MIIVKGRELLIPENERYIGTNYDANVENRVFRIGRYSQSGTDLANLTFYINLMYNGEVLDLAEMTKVVDDDYITLTWNITAAQVSATGTIFAEITGNDTQDTVKWSSFRAAFYTEESISKNIENQIAAVIEEVKNARTNASGTAFENLKARNDADYILLSGMIDTEATSRSNAISEETTARQNAISEETTARQNAIAAEASARATQDALLQSEIDEIIAPTGTAPSAAEIENARIGANGVTYLTLGAAIRTQVSALDEDIKRIGWSYCTLSVIPSSTWAVQASGYSYVIPVKSGDVIYIKNTKTSALYAVLKSLSGINTSGASVDFAAGYSTSLSAAKNAEVKLTVPSDGAYIWLYGNDPGRTDNVYFPDTLLINGVSVSNTVISAMVLLHDMSIDIAGLQKSPMGTRIHFSQDQVIEGYYVVASNGSLSPSADYRCTDYIPVNGKKVGVSRGMAQFAFYDYEKNYVGGVAVASGIHDYTEYDIPDDASYVRFSFYSEQYADLRYVYCVFSDGLNFPFDDWVVVANTYLGKCPEFTTVRKAIEYAVQFKNARVLIRSGEYDLLDEFSSEINNSQSTQYGLGVGNGIHVYGESGAVISCLYDGSDQNVITYMSPFWSLHVDGGYTLENIEVHSSNCRYCVHDEYSGAENVIKNEYRNCRFYHDDTGAGTLEGYYPQCIGGGCAKNTYAVIDGCYFYSKAAESAITPLVSYHNSSHAYSQNEIVVSNSYFDNYGTFRCSYYGTTTMVSRAIVSNCSLGAEPIITSESGGTYPGNFELRTFLNEIRI